MAFVKQKPPLLAEIGSKSVVLGEQGRFIFHAGRRNPKQGRYFFQSIPIAMRHGGHERRVSASASFPWPKQVVAMKMKRSVSETAAGGATQVAQLRLLKPTARKKSPCCECLRRKRDNFRLHAENGAKWAIFTVYGEFCTGWGGPACVQGEFCPGWRAKRSTGGAQVADLLAPSAAISGPVAAPARPTWPRPRPLALAGECEVHEEQVERDDDGRDEETGDAQGTIVGVVAHDIAVGGQAHERDDREGDAE